MHFRKSTNQMSVDELERECEDLRRRERRARDHGDNHRAEALLKARRRREARIAKRGSQ